MKQVISRNGYSSTSNSERSGRKGMCTHNLYFLNVILTAWETDIGLRLGRRKNDRAHGRLGYVERAGFAT